MTYARLALPLTVALAACTGTIPGGGGGGGDDDGAGAPDAGAESCVAGRSYVGLGGAPLEADRAVLAAGADRLRLKPFGALAAEYSRALGLAGFSTEAYADTFGRLPARWYAEPAAGANSLYAAFALAFDACGQLTASGAAYAAAPTAATADLECRALARRAWDRDATDDEASVCASYAVNQTRADDPPRRRWAYACAAVLSAAGFLSY